jgi:hypothetical protein
MGYPEASGLPSLAVQSAQRGERAVLRPTVICTFLRGISPPGCVDSIVAT